MSRNGEERRAKAETEFDAYLRLAKAGKKPSFEEFCRERPHLEDALKFLYSLHFHDSAAEAEPRESVGVSVEGEEDRSGRSATREARYCTGCGREIGNAPVCPDPACGTPNFFRDMVRPLRASRSHVAPRPETTTPRDENLASAAEPAFAVLRAVSPPLVEYSLHPGVAEIGAHPPADIVIDCAEVSARHARIESRPGENDAWEVILTDHGSTNGTYVSGEPIRSRTLVDGDRIRFGSVEFEIRFLTGHRVTMKIDRPS